MARQAKHCYRPRPQWPAGRTDALHRPRAQRPFRWFTDPTARARYHPDDHDKNSRVNVAQLRAAVTRDGPGSPAADLVEFLHDTNEEFTRLWELHEVGLHWSDTKRFVHPEIGRLDLYCQLLLEPDQGQSLLIFTATPGTEDEEKLALLKVLGLEKFTVATE
nr:hypothetical protein [Nocardia sp. alder85J]